MKVTNTFLALACALILPFAASAQNWQMLEGIESNGSSTHNSIKTDAGGNLYVAGGFQNTIGFSPITLSTSDYNGYLVKYNQAGVPDWTLQCLGPESEIMGVDLVGSNVFIVGYYRDSMTIGTTTLYSAGGYDGFAARLDFATGALTWAYSYGGAGDDFVTSLACFAGTFAMTGMFYGTTQFGTFPLVSAGDGDMFICLLNTSGTVTFADRRGGTLREAGIRMDHDASGLWYVAGQFESPTVSFATGTLTSQGNNDVFVVKFNGVGTEQWAASGGSPNYDYANGICVEGNTVCLMGTYGTGNIVFSPYGIPDQGVTNTSSIINFDTQTGSVSGLATVCFGSDVFSGDIVAVNGAIYATGYFSGNCQIGSTPCVSAGLRDIFIVRYIPQMQSVVLACTGGGSGDEMPRAMCADQNGLVSITGDYQGVSTTFGSNSITNTDATADGYVARASITVGINDVASSGSITMYPNPFADRLTVQQPDGTESDVVLYDATGREAKRVRAIGSTEIMCDDLAAGVYMVMVIGEEEVHSEKMIKQ